jgi:IMP dehydrogenase
VDTAHGHSSRVLEALKTLRRTLPDVQLVAGNVATAEATTDLIRLEVDAIKVGIGPGSICTTRIISGAGVPQITAVSECARAAKGSGIPIVSDGGVKYSGDITKALAAGADTVMIGGLFADTEESPGETILYQGRSYKLYRGMGSLEAIRDREGSRNRYMQDGEAETMKLVPEGIEGRVPYKGALSFIIGQLVGGLQAGMGYCGCRTIPDLQENARFMRITSASVEEGHVHDVFMTKEPPNYRRD